MSFVRCFALLCLVSHLGSAERDADKGDKAADAPAASSSYAARAMPPARSEAAEAGEHDRAKGDAVRI